MKKIPVLGLRLRSPSYSERLLGTLPPHESPTPVRSFRRDLPFAGRHGIRLSRLQFIGFTIVMAFVFSCIVVYVRGTSRLPILLSDPVSEVVEDGNMEEAEPEQPFGSEFFWFQFPRLEGYYGGIRSLVPLSQWNPDSRQEPSLQAAQRLKQAAADSQDPPNPDRPLPVIPVPDFKSPEHLAQHGPASECFLDENDGIPVPDIFAYPGVPQGMPMPSFGSFEEVGVRQDICYDRFGRLGPYGLGYSVEEGGTGVDTDADRDRQGAEVVWQQGRVNYTDINWGLVQKRCREKNMNRFSTPGGGEQPGTRRSALLLRSYTMFDTRPFDLMNARALISELSLKSGGEFDVHLLVQAKDDVNMTVGESAEVDRMIIEEHVPRELWDMATLWSEASMERYYPGPFPDDKCFWNEAGVGPYTAWRGQHLPLQKFAQDHPEYEYLWTWEIDMRYSGHYYELFDRVANWAKKQPRKDIWERNNKYWIPGAHGDYQQFARNVSDTTIARGDIAVWGPVTFPNNGMLEHPEGTTPPRPYLEDNYEWGVGEEADFITFSSIFDAGTSAWVYRADITNYDINLPEPPRRAAVVTVGRFSRRLLDLMHKEVSVMKHNAVPEMWPATVCVHHGLKAVSVPHPVYFNRAWPSATLDEFFNTRTKGIYSTGEHNWWGASYYYSTLFAGELWRRWLGQKELYGGGTQYENNGTGRMCLRATLLHPVKGEDGAYE